MAGDDSNTLVTTHHCPPNHAFCKIKYVTENAFDMNIMGKNALVPSSELQKRANRANLLVLIFPGRC